MKKLFVFGAFVLALTACKNDKTTIKTDDKSTPSNTSSTTETTTPVTTPTTTTPSTTEGTSGLSGNGWSTLERTTFLQTCTEKAAGTMGQDKAADYCACMGEKLEEMYPNANQAGSMTEAKMKELAKDCLK